MHICILAKSRILEVTYTGGHPDAHNKIPNSAIKNDGFRMGMTCGLFIQVYILHRSQKMVNYSTELEIKVICSPCL